MHGEIREVSSTQAGLPEPKDVGGDPRGAGHAHGIFL